MSEIKYRVHTTAGHFDVRAKTPADAANAVKRDNPEAFVKKVKVIKGEGE